jgi:peptidoglycan hydrolase-like protein with peptidoglycan-binding domain
MLDSEISPSAAREVSAPPGPAPRRRRRRGVVLGGTAVLAVGAAGGAVYALQGGEPSAPPSNTTLPTAPVVRTDMVNIRNVDGTLGYAGDYTVLAGSGGRITWLPDVGDVIRRGQRAYGVDGRTVPLLYGSTPFWRDLRQGMSKGRDVLQLERNLDALGYGDGMTVDRTFSYATYLAIRDWQDDLNVTRTGVLKPDSVVVQPGPIRVTKLSKVPGVRAGGTVLTATGTDRVVTVKLPVNDQTIARKGAKVRITLPGGKTVTGRITSVGTVATAANTNAQSQTGEGTQNATIPVSVTLGRSSDAGRLDLAPATVGFAGTEHKNVLAVPVNALVASAEGAYSVKVVDATGAVRTVPVKLGIFDGDRVEVSGDLTAGMKVQVPRS